MELEKQKVYKAVYRAACDELLSSQPGEKFRKGGLTFTAQGTGYTVHIPFFDEVITLTVPDFSFQSSTSANITLVAKIIVLHYINTASGLPMTGDKIPYEDIPGCRHYQTVYEKRVIKPLIAAFGHDKYVFREAGLALGGTEEEYGDASFTLHALPMVPITFILWEGDEEFPPTGRTLFDPAIAGYLPLEDVVVLSKLAVTRIIKAARIRYSGEVTS
jgi:hypothetical protein